MFTNIDETVSALFKLLRFDFDSSCADCMVIVVDQNHIDLAKQLSRKLSCNFDFFGVEYLKAKNIIFGAVTELGNKKYLHPKLAKDLELNKPQLEELITRTVHKASVSANKFRKNLPLINFDNRNIFLVIDGIGEVEFNLIMATGIEIFLHNPAKLSLVSPVIDKTYLSELEAQFDAVYFLNSPDNFFDTKQWYLN